MIKYKITVAMNNPSYTSGLMYVTHEVEVDKPLDHEDAEVIAVGLGGTLSSFRKVES